MAARPERFREALAVIEGDSMPIVVLNAAQSRVIVIGGGTDGPSIEIDLATGKVIKHPGWGIDVLTEFTTAIEVLQGASRLKTPRVLEQVAAPLGQFLQKELEGYLRQSIPAAR